MRAEVDGYKIHGSAVYDQRGWYTMDRTQLRELAALSAIADAEGLVEEGETYEEKLAAHLVCPPTPAPCSSKK